MFFVDDNFIGNRRKLKQDVLPAIIDWMEKRRNPFTFYTQTSINLADDDELMQLLGQAGFECVFIGIETVGDNGFLECHKLQNRNRDLVACVHKIQQAGIQVHRGFILGFDSDPPAIFDEMIEFVQRSGIATAMVGLLAAPSGTKLYERLAREGRLLGKSSGNNTDGYLNFVPKMELDELLEGYCKVVGTLYRHDVYYDRLWQFLHVFRPLHKANRGYGWRDARTLLACLYRLGIQDEGRGRFWRLLFRGLRHPRDFHRVLTPAVLGYHFRRVFADYQAQHELGTADAAVSPSCEV